MAHIGNGGAAKHAMPGIMLFTDRALPNGWNALRTMFFSLACAMFACCAVSARAQNNPVATSIAYWGANENDRLSEFRAFAARAVFLDGDGVNSATYEAKFLIREMLRLAQASSDPNAMFRSEEFQRFLSVPAQRFGFVSAIDPVARLLEYGVALCPAASLEEDCLVRRLALSVVWREKKNIDGSLAVLEPILLENPAAQADGKLAFVRNHVEKLRAERDAQADSPESVQIKTERMAELKSVSSRVLNALKNGNSQEARLAMAGLPPATSDDPTLSMRRLLAFVDGDQATASALAAIAPKAAAPCDYEAWFFANPSSDALPPKGIPGCTDPLARQQAGLDRYWASAAFWSGRDLRVINSASRFSARWIGDIITGIDQAMKENDRPVFKYLDNEDIPILSHLVSVGLSRNEKVPQNEANTLFRTLQALNMSPLAQSIGLRIAERRAVRADPQISPLIQEYLELKYPARAYTPASSTPRSDANRDNRPVGPAAEYNRENELLAQINRRVPDYVRSILPRLYSLKETQALLGPGEVLVVLNPAAQGTMTFAVAADGVAWASGKWDPAKIGRAVTRLRWDVYGTGTIPVEVENRWVRDAGTEPGFDRTLAYELFQELFGGVLPVLKGKDTLFVLTAGDLASIPMGILVTAPPQGSDSDPVALRDTPWLAETMAIAALPSIQMLDFLRTSRIKTQADRPDAILAGFGDPALSSVKVERGERSATGRPRARNRNAVGTRQIASINEMIELPGTRVELLALKAALGAPDASVRLAADATEAAFRASLDQKPALLSFATHGVLPFEVQGLSEGALILTPGEAANSANDGILQSSEIAQMRLFADWVILSACNSGFSSGRTNAFMGLPEAFLLAGAQSLLVSHWPVMDEVAPVLTVRAVEIARDQKVGKARALQLAMREVRNSPANPHWSHPAAWGPFELVSDGK